jgi:predicted small secreted protein
MSLHIQPAGNSVAGSRRLVCGCYVFAAWLPHLSGGNMNKIQAISALACALLLAGCGSMSGYGQSSSGQSNTGQSATGQSSYTGELTSEQRRLSTGGWTQEQRELYYSP